MRIRAKFILLQLIIVSGFVGVIVFTMIHIYQTYSIKDLKLKALISMAELRTLERETFFLSRRSDYLERLWNDWYSLYHRFDQGYTDMFDSRYHRLLCRNVISKRDALSEAWARIKELEIEPIIRDFEEIIAGPLPAMVGNSGIRAARESIVERIGFDSPEAKQLVEIDARFSKLRESLLSSIFIPPRSSLKMCVNGRIISPASSTSSR